MLLSSAVLSVLLAGSVVGSAHSAPACLSMSTRHATIDAELHMELADDARPQVDATTTVRLPIESPNAAALRQASTIPTGLSSSDDGNRNAISCLFPGDGWGYYPNRVSVAIEAGELVLRHHISSYVWRLDRTQVGPWDIDMRRTPQIDLRLLRSESPTATWTAKLTYNGMRVRSATVLADEDNGVDTMNWTVKRPLSPLTINGQVTRSASLVLAVQDPQLRLVASGLRFVSIALPLALLVWIRRRTASMLGAPVDNIRGVGWLGLLLLAVSAVFGFTVGNWYGPIWPKVSSIILVMTGGILYVYLMPSQFGRWAVIGRRQRAIVLLVIMLVAIATSAALTALSNQSQLFSSSPRSTLPILMAALLFAINGYLWYASLLGFTLSRPLRSVGPRAVPWLRWLVLGMLVLAVVIAAQWSWLALTRDDFFSRTHLRFFADGLASLVPFLVVAALVGLLAEMSRAEQSISPLFPRVTTGSAPATTSWQGRQRHGLRPHDVVVVLLFCTAVVGSDHELLGLHLPLAFGVTFVLLWFVLRWSGLVEWAEDRAHADNSIGTGISVLAGWQLPMLVSLDEARLLVGRLKNIETEYSEGKLSDEEFEDKHNAIRLAINRRQRELVFSPALIQAPAKPAQPVAASVQRQVPDRWRSLVRRLTPDWWTHGRVESQRTASQTGSDQVRARLVVPPMRLALSLGPRRSWWNNGRRAAWYGLWLAVPLIIWFLASALIQSDNPSWPFTSGFGVFGFALTVLRELTFWVVAAFVLGVLYAYLPGAWGMLKGVWLAGVYFVALSVEAAARHFFGQPAAAGWLIRTILMTVFLSLVGLLLDIETMRQYYFRAAAIANLYRLTRLRGVVVYVTSLVVAGLAVYQQIRAGQTANPFTNPDQAAKLAEQLAKFAQQSLPGGTGQGGG